MKKVIVSLAFIYVSLAGMQRPSAIGLIKTDQIMRACNSCCTKECCPMATIVSGIEVLSCLCLLNPALSDTCDADPFRRMAKAGIGAAFLGVLGACNRTIKKAKNGA